MTIPYQHNCQHTDSGWCLACVEELAAELEREQEDAERFRWLCKNGFAWRGCYNFFWKEGEWIYSNQNAREHLDSFIKKEGYND